MEDEFCTMSEVFGRRVAEYRKVRGLSMREFGRLAHLSPNVINDWEKGRRHPNYKNLMKVARVMECTTDELLGR